MGHVQLAPLTMAASYERREAEVADDPSDMITVRTSGLVPICREASLSIRGRVFLTDILLSAAADYTSLYIILHHCTSPYIIAHL
jgi:hypothetical protein